LAGVMLADTRLHVEIAIHRLVMWLLPAGDTADDGSRRSAAAEVRLLVQMR
jgi:hypothetical protein